MAVFESLLGFPLNILYINISYAIISRILFHKPRFKLLGIDTNSERHASEIQEFYIFCVFFGVLLISLEFIFMLVDPKTCVWLYKLYEKEEEKIDLSPSSKIKICKNELQKKIEIPIDNRFEILDL